MTDTSEDARQKQREIILSKTVQERLVMGLQMMEDVRQIVLNSIRIKNPGISEVDLKIEFVKRYYKNDFSPERLADIIQWFKAKG